MFSNHICLWRDRDTNKHQKQWHQKPTIQCSYKMYWVIIKYKYTESILVTLWWDIFFKSCLRENNLVYREGRDDAHFWGYFLPLFAHLKCWGFYYIIFFSEIVFIVASGVCYSLVAFKFASCNLVSGVAYRTKWDLLCRFWLWSKSGFGIYTVHVSGLSAHSMYSVTE